MNIDCNEDIEMTFDVYIMDLPVLLIVRPKHNLYTTAIVKELDVSLNDYVKQALEGKIGHLKYEKMPKLNLGRCDKDISDQNDNNRIEL